jgi:integrase
MPPILAPEEERKLIDALEAALQDTSAPKYLKYLRDALLFSFGLYAGLRIGECTALKISNVAWEGKRMPTLFIQKGFWKNCLEAHIPWHPTLARLIDLWLPHRLPMLPEGVTDGILLINRKDAIRQDRAISRPGVTYMIRFWTDRAKIKPFIFHLMRHTFGSRIAGQGSANLSEAQHLLRHRSLRSTQVYLFAPQESLNKVFEKAYENSPVMRV